MDVAAIRAGIATQLRTISGLNVFAYMPDGMSPPAAVIGFPDQIQYDSTMMGGSHDATFEFYILVGRTDDRSANSLLNQYMSTTGAKSVYAALATDTTLDGSVDSSSLRTAETVFMDFSGVEYVAALFAIDVLTSI
jgi:hypothetical protein